MRENVSLRRQELDLYLRQSHAERDLWVQNLDSSRNEAQMFRWLRHQAFEAQIPKFAIL